MEPWQLALLATVATVLWECGTGLFEALFS